MKIVQDTKSVLDSLQSANEYWKKGRIKSTLGQPYNYEGPTAADAIRSYVELTRDLTVTAGLKLPDGVSNQIDIYISKFVNAFFLELTKRTTGEEVEEFATLCKARQKDLLKVSNFFLANNLREAYEYLYLISGTECDYAIKLEKSRYISKSMKTIMVYLEEDDLLLGEVTLQSNPRFYIYLYKILFLLMEHYSLNKENIRNAKAMDALLLLPSSFGQMFEKLNPTPEIMDRKGRELLEVLCQPGQEPSKEFWELFESVKNDIEEGISNIRKAKPYVKEFCTALRDFSWKGYSKGQFYATLKASTYHIEVLDKGKIRKYNFPSFISSLFEPDEAKDLPEVKTLDEFLNYKSRYLSSVKAEKVFDFKVKGYRAITKMIPNPSKYKPRAIHLCGQADQDRLANIHENVGKFLDSLPSDAKKNHHKKGVTFLIKITDPKHRTLYKNSIFVSDFSNATDTLNQEFQNACLALIAPKEIVDYWSSISKMPKVFIFQDGTEQPYVQESGQPQGYLGSFDAFSLAHHVLMLMLMKASGHSKCLASEFYRILGDDSIVSFKEDGKHQTYDIHSWLCQEANLVKNDAKTGKSYYSLDQDIYDVEILDFAKISISEGQFVTPVPSGLAQNYSKSFEDKIATILWFNDHEVTFSEWLYAILLRKYGDKPVDLLHALSVFSSGQVPYLERFKDDSIFNQIDSSVSGLALYSYGLSELQNSLMGYFVSDERKSQICKSDTSFESLWSGFFNHEILMQWAMNLDSEHKFWILLEEAESLKKDIQDLYEIGEPELAACVGALISRNDILDDLRYTLNWISQFKSKDKEEAWEYLSYFSYRDVFTSTKAMQELEVRSLRMKESNRSHFLRKSIKENKKWEDKLHREDIITSYIGVLNHIEQLQAG